MRSVHHCRRALRVGAGERGSPAAPFPCTPSLAKTAGLDQHETGDISIEAKQGTLLSRYDTPSVNVLTSKRYNITLVIVPQLKRATVYFDPSLHKALRVKAAHTDRSLSELVNAAVRQTLGEDAQDLATFAARAKEPALSFEEVLKDLKRRGKL
jgi:hypothetical protein